MSLDESIDALVNATVTVTRRTGGGYNTTTGVYEPGASSTFTADVVMQPAFGLNRVVGGADLHAHVDNQTVTDVRDFFTRTKFNTREATANPDVYTDPDVVTYKGVDWTVARVEVWDLGDGDEDDNETYYRVLITKVTKGGSA